MAALGGGGGGGLNGRGPCFTVVDVIWVSSSISSASFETANCFRGFGGVGGGGAGRSRCTGGVSNNFLSLIGVVARPIGVNNKSSGVLIALIVVAVEKPLIGDKADEPPLTGGMLILGKVILTRVLTQSLKSRFSTPSRGLSTLVE